MNTQEFPKIDKLVRWLLLVALFPAGAAAVISWVAYIEYFEHLGGGAKAVGLAFLVAAAVGSAYMAIVHVLLNGAAKLPQSERSKITPIIVIVWLIISLASAFPIFINASKGIATNASAQAYISQVMASSDRLKAGALVFEQAGPLIDNELTVLTSFRLMEIGGVYSGVNSEGALARWIAGFIERLREVRSSLSQASERTRDLVVAIDRSIDKMRNALIDPELSLKQRSRAMQRAGDDVRSSMVALRQAAPVMALNNLAASFQAVQARPKLSNDTKIRRGQEEGIRRITSELRRIGRDLERRVEDMAQALKVRIPAYEMPSDSILVLSNLAAVPHVAAMSFGLDSLPFAIYLIVARLYDAERARLASMSATSTLWRTGGNGPSPNAPLGSHPHPNATRSRSNGPMSDDDDHNTGGSGK